MLRAFPDATVHTTLYNPAGRIPEFREARVVTSPINRIARSARTTASHSPSSRGRSTGCPSMPTSSSPRAAGGPTACRPQVASRLLPRAGQWLYQPAAYLGHQPSAWIKGRALQTMSPMAAPVGPSRRRERRPLSCQLNGGARPRQGRLRNRRGDRLPDVGVGDDGPQREVREVADWRDGYHLVVSRLLPYKNVYRGDCRLPRVADHRLVVVGHGPLEDDLRADFPSNVRLVNRLDDAGLRWVYAHATALIAPSIEDFGLTPLEAGAFGKPTLALRGGGYLDTVVEDVTGMFFDAPTPDAIRSAVLAASLRRWDGEAITKHVDQFSEPRFHERLTAEVEGLLALRR